MSRFDAFLAVAVIAAVTAALRILPALLFGGGRKTPDFILYLSKVLPCAIMGMLVVYCLRDMNFSAVSAFVPQILSVLVVAGMHVWKRNSLLSILSGTVCYMLLVQLVF